MKFMQGQIFSKKLFREYSIRDAYLNKPREYGLDVENDGRAEYHGTLIADEISLFDYILGSKMELFPFNPQNCYGDYMGIRTVSPQTVEKFKKFWARKDKTFMEGFNAILLHEDLFVRVKDLDVSGYYAFLNIDPESYKICCMQWDCYKHIFFAVFDTMERAVIKPADYHMETYRQERYECIQLTCVKNYLPVQGDITEVYDHFVTDNTGMYILCDQTDECVDIWGSNIRTASRPFIGFTSFLGTVYATTHWNKDGNINTNYVEYDEDMARGQSWDTGMLGRTNPAYLPRIRVSESFFSDIM